MPTIVAAVSHKEYRTMSLAELTSGLRQGGVSTDVKSDYDRQQSRRPGLSLVFVGRYSGRQARLGCAVMEFGVVRCEHAVYRGRKAEAACKVGCTVHEVGCSPLGWDCFIGTDAILAVAFLAASRQDESDFDVGEDLETIRCS